MCMTKARRGHFVHNNVTNINSCVSGVDTMAATLRMPRCHQQQQVPWLKLSKQLSIALPAY
jgi:hypothetical protein